MTSTATSQLQIPIIDIRPENQNAPQQLLDAASRFGFVFIENNEAGISPSLISQTFALSQQFFALAPEEKEKVSIKSNKAGKNHGWLGQGVEKLDPGTQKRPDVKEAFNLSLPSPTTGTYPQPLPPLFASEENLSTLRAFQTSCAQLCARILELFARALELPAEDWFSSRHDAALGPTGTVFRLLYYPPRPEDYEDGVDIRAGAHSDYGSVTALFQRVGEGGLEIWRGEGEGGEKREGKGGKWVGVSAEAVGEGGQVPVLINIGDLLEDWTAGLLKSTRHRVVFPEGGKEKGKGEGRYSVAYFCHPLDEAVLEPVPSRVVEEFVKRTGGKKGANGGKVITAEDHLMSRLAATYQIKK